MNSIGNRNSTPEAGSSSLRPPSSRSTFGSGHVLRASADMGAQSNGPLSARGIRPASEVYPGSRQQGQGQGTQDDSERAAQQWISDIDASENTLEEMAAATLDQDFKDELSAIEQWFRVLSEAERTAALYALLQQTTQVQIRFFVGVLQQMGQSHPMSGVLSPSNFDSKDPMTNRLSHAMNRLSVSGNERHSLVGGRAPPSPGAPKRVSGMDQDQINSMFPDAAASISKQKAEFTRQTGQEAPRSNRSSAVVGDRSSLAAPSISAPGDEKRESFSQSNPSPWGQRSADNSSARPKSSSGQAPMGQFMQPPPSAGLRSSRGMPLSSDNNIQSTTLNAPTQNNNGFPLSPYSGSGNWASMVNTPMTANFSKQQSQDHAASVANATAMKLQALDTVNNRVQLDDVRKYRRARSSEDGPTFPGLGNSGMPSNFVMTNERGQILSPQEAAARQAQGMAVLQGGRSRPSSPGVPIQGQGFGMGLPMAQNNGFLYPGQPGIMNGMSGLSVGSYAGMGDNAFLADPSDINRGRSPRGKRGSSRPPEDPADPELLRDIPNWLRSLRLHKYTDNFKDMNWQDLVQLDEAGLEAKGVAAKGARTKMLKVFEEVREAQQKGKI